MHISSGLRRLHHRRDLFSCLLRGELYEASSDWLHKSCEGRKLRSHSVSKEIMLVLEERVKSELHNLRLVVMGVE